VNATGTRDAETLPLAIFTVILELALISETIFELKVVRGVPVSRSRGDAIPVYPSRYKDEAIASAEMDVVLSGASGHGRLLTRPQPASDSQQAKNCNRRSPDCQVSLPTANNYSR